MALSSSKVSSFNGFSLSPISGNDFKKLNLSSFCNLRVDKKRRSGKFTVSAATTVPLTGVIFEPFEEVKKDYLAVPIVPQVSLARQNFADECESVINEQINVEYNVSYVYHSMFAYFDRDNVALKGFAKTFVAEELYFTPSRMCRQNLSMSKKGMHCMVSYFADFITVLRYYSCEAVHRAMELALSLEKLTNEKLLNVHSVADRNNDPEMTHFIESEFLAEQVEAIKKIAEYVSQLRRVGKGHGVWHFDQRLLHAA
ncbi:hypothetical protein TSUD_161650 [Trifolium subterraneum]|uniref:Ferritin n=1 Tax=Trifolium subterraneum TaxID=3900 RepID=A0A2Z6N148_TRISU|nr:hypothetical protein TSUD_161650 [Trifolium subterraneum]